jgi:hypothetical protein
MTLRRTVVGALQSLAGAFVWLSAVATYNRSAAQVGHDPAHSPYRDIKRGAGPRIVVGYLGGDRGRVPVGVSKGATFGLRYEVWLSGVTSLTAGVAYGQTSRFIVNPTDSAYKRTRGPVDNDVILTDLTLQFSLSGAKTWHGIAPYVSTGLGLAFGSNLPSDSSGYRFGTKFTIAPGAGVRFYPTRRLSIQTDTRVVFWKLRYPIDFKQLADDGTRVLALNAPETDWTVHPWISIGIGWTF